MLGQRIAALRRQRGLSQAELAAYLGISASAMGMYEQGRREPSADTLVRLARQLQVTTDFLLTGELNSQMDEQTYSRMLLNLIDCAQERSSRRSQPLSRQELALLLAALIRD